MLNRNVRFLGTLCLMWMTVVFIEVPVIGAEGVPADAKKVIDTFEKETAAIRRKGEDRTSAAQEKLLKKLKELQVEQTKAGNLDEAIVIRDHVRAIEADKKAGNPSKFDTKSLSQLPSDAQAAILAYEEAVGESDKTLTAELGAKQTAYDTRLKELLAAYTKEGKLDEALAIRSHLTAAPAETTAPAIKIVGPAVNLGGASTDFATVEKRYRELAAAQGAANVKAYQRAAELLIPKLNASLTVHTKAGRLDPAVTIRTLVQNLNPTQSPMQLGQVARAARDRLPPDAVILLDAFLAQYDELDKQSTAQFAKLNAAFAPRVELETRKQLLAGNLEAARQLLSQSAALQGKAFPYSWAGHYHRTPELSEQAKPFFERFADAKSERLEQANAELAPVRKKVIETLKKELEAKPGKDEKDALEETLELLDDEDHSSIPSMLLFVTDKRLPAPAVAALREFRNAVKKSLADLGTQNTAAIKQLATDLVPVRDAHVMAGELEAAFILLERQQLLNRVFDPILVKVSGAAGHPFAWDGTVVDAKDGQFLVAYTSREEWLPRDRFRVGNEWDAIKVQMGGSTDDNSAPPNFNFNRDPLQGGPGKPVGAKVKLKPGQRLMGHSGFGWYSVTVVAVGESGVKVRWDNHRGGTEEVLERTRLRDVSDE